MYIIQKHGFDNMENRNPWYTDIIGYIDTDDEETAKKYVEGKTENAKKYKGWDGKMYPYFTYTALEKLL